MNDLLRSLADALKASLADAAADRGAADGGETACECWKHFTSKYIAENDEQHTCTECGQSW
jgi:hypothetical protein